MEINASPYFTEATEKLTPACSDPSLVCPAGNVDIDGKSAMWSPIGNNIDGVIRQQHEHLKQQLNHQSIMM